MSNIIATDAAVVISDLHIGDPENRALEDFDREGDFERLLREVIPRSVGRETTLVLAGDSVDFPQVLPELARKSPGDTYGASESESLEKMRRVIRGHSRVFTAMRRYMDAGGRIVLLPGNHDVDFHWPAVMEAMRQAIGGATEPAFRFLGNGILHERGLHIEHGNQYSYDNYFEHWEHPILESPDGWRLERPWGTLFMDLSYNDIEAAYPFVNKVHPQARLAWIVLRSFIGNGEHVPAGTIARLVVFFLTKGKRMISEHLLGGRDCDSDDTVETLVNRLADGASQARIDAIIAEARRLLDAHVDSGLPSQGQTCMGLLGRSDERGLRERAQELHESGDITLVVFGHTHEPVDGNVAPSWGERDPRRMFNTGTWMPQIVLSPGEYPQFSELRSRSWTHDLRFLIVTLEEPPRAQLCQILS